MVDHFHEQVLARNKIGGQARAMVVTSGIERAIQYFHAIRDYLKERKSPVSGDRRLLAASYEYGGAKVTESSLNGFPSERHSPTGFRKTRTAFWSAPTSFRPATTSRCCIQCTWTSRSQE